MSRDYLMEIRSSMWFVGRGEVKERTRRKPGGGRRSGSGTSGGGCRWRRCSGRQEGRLQLPAPGKAAPKKTRVLFASLLLCVCDDPRSAATGKQREKQRTILTARKNEMLMMGEKKMTNVSQKSANKKDKRTSRADRSCASYSLLLLHCCRCC